MATRSSSVICKILVPVHRQLTDFEIEVVGHNLERLSHYEAILFGPENIGKVLESTAEKLQQATGSTVTTELFGSRYFQDAFCYSCLLLKMEFYSRFDDASHVLICQPDAFIFSGNLEPWLASGYSFLGAPIFKGYEKPVLPLQFSGLLNGGLSLRNVADAKNALRDVFLVRESLWVRRIRALGLLEVANLLTNVFGKRILIIPGKPHEDVVWTGSISDAVKEFKTPKLEVASKFAFETMSSYLFEKNEKKLPFGCHAFAVYEPEFWRSHFPDWAQESLV